MDRPTYDDKAPMGADRLVLQLSLPALERMIGGDTETEVKLRHQIVNNFARKHLREVAADPAFAAVVESHRKVIDAELRNLVGEHVWKDGRSVAVLQERVAKLINSAIENIVEGVVKRSFDAQIKKYQQDADDRITRYEVKMTGSANERLQKAHDRIEAELNARVDKFFDERVQAEVKRRLDAAAQLTA